jgi:hypothetical protein
MSLDINLTNVESTTNKKTTLTDNSDTFYPTQKAVKTAVDAKFNTPTGTTAQYLRGDGSLETFPTIPDPSDFVEKSDFTSHSILAKQSGASDPVAVSIGNNEILGRKSGGGSNIEGLSVSEVKAILNYTASDVGAPSGSGSSTGTNTGDETQSTILAKLGWFQHNRVTESTAVTGTTAETIIENITIPANTFASGGILRSYNNKFRKVGTAGSLTVKFYIGQNANNLSGATQIATVSIPSTNRFAEMLRTFTATTTSLLGWASATSTTTDTTLTTADRTETAVTWSVEQNFIITVQLGNSADSVTLIGASLKNF